MSNVVNLFGRKPTKDQPPVDVSGLIMAITNWAEDQGVDVYNDTAFHIRVGDLMAHLQVMAKEGRRRA